jgi:hypothetical protein
LWLACVHQHFETGHFDVYAPLEPTVPLCFADKLSRENMMDGSFRPHCTRLVSSLATLALCAAISKSLGAACPFDGGGSDTLNDGVVLTRYALGITGSPLTASTRYASLDPLHVKANIECVGCALDMNGDNQVDTIDTTVIARHLAGFQGNALTNGLALGSGVRNTAASVTSFLANGCAVGGTINAFVQGGNAFGTPAVLGTIDSQPMTVRSVGGNVNLLVNSENDGLRIFAAPSFGDRSPNLIGGITANTVDPGLIGATISGGGSIAFFEGFNRVVDDFGTIGGGFKNSVGYSGAIAGGNGNTAGSIASVGGGADNSAIGLGAVVAGGGGNSASGVYATVAGGEFNWAVGSHGFAAGRRAKSNHNGAFVWGDATNADVASTASNQFVVRANGGIRLPGAGENQPGNSAKQSGTNMFTHVVPTTGPCRNDEPFGRSRTAIDHPLLNGKPDAILVVTPNIGVRTQLGTGYGKVVNVMYDDDGGSACNVAAVGRWLIVNPNGDADMTAGMKFNVFVINP